MTIRNRRVSGDFYVSKANYIMRPPAAITMATTLTLSMSLLFVGGSTALAATPFSPAPLTASASTEQPGDIVTFADSNVENPLREQNSIPAGTPITRAMMAEITQFRFNAHSAAGEITDLRGLEAAVNLKYLRLWETNLADTSALASLTKLRDVGFTSSTISSFAVLDSMPQLHNLYLSDMNIDSLAPFAGLTSLTTLEVVGGTVSDLSSLKNLTGLTRLWLSYLPNVSDISAVAGMKGLRDIGLMYTAVSDFSPLHGLPINGNHVLGGQTAKTAPVYVPVDSTVYIGPTVPESLILREPQGGEKSVKARSIDWMSHIVNTAPTDTWKITPKSTAIEGGFVTEVDGKVRARDRKDSLPAPDFHKHVASLDDFVEARGDFSSPIIWSKVTSAQPTGFTAGEKFSFTMTTTEGFPVKHWSLSDPIPGLSIADDGTLSGTPTTAGKYSTVAIATDTWGNVLTSPLSVTVAAPGTEGTTGSEGTTGNEGNEGTTANGNESTTGNEGNEGSTGSEGNTEENSNAAHDSEGDGSTNVTPTPQPQPAPPATIIEKIIPVVVAVVKYIWAGITSWFRGFGH